MKLIKQIDSACVFINFTAERTFRTGVRVIIEAQAIVYKHTAANNQGEPDGRWKFDGGIEIMDQTIMIGKRVLNDGDAKAFMEGNKAAGVDYMDKAIKAIEAEMEILGADELAIQAGIVFKDKNIIESIVKN